MRTTRSIVTILACITSHLLAQSGPPTLTSISPNTGVQGTSVDVTLVGADFVTGAAISTSNSGITVSNLIIVSTTQMTATFSIDATASLGSANVTIITDAGTSTPIPFAVNPPPPTITSISPNIGQPWNTYFITLTGTNFVTGATVAITNPSVMIINVTVKSTTEITAVFIVFGNNDVVASDAAVTVTTTGGTSNPVTFTYMPRSPIIRFMNPSAGG